MRTGQGFLMVYSITSRSSFDEITSFREQILRVKDADKAPMVLVANKSDLENERQVTTGEGQDLAKSFSIPFMETSAKARINVDEAFMALTKQVYDSLPDNEKKTVDDGSKLKTERKVTNGGCCN